MLNGDERQEQTQQNLKHFFGTRSGLYLTSLLTEETVDKTQNPEAFCKACFFEEDFKITLRKPCRFYKPLLSLETQKVVIFLISEDKSVPRCTCFEEHANYNLNKTRSFTRSRPSNYHRNCPSDYH
ncbi:hypothetical protein L596_002446 [Steinernema carpocapsae]|uniref:Uncharacterized protein n=1 Tax=Steinernema carpocapsae TaxID=34508 RepID=A0A4V6I7P7_STECR|nr:hypothetical protein L596_002446 [Steinernema carpocapsae]